LEDFFNLNLCVERGWEDAYGEVEDLNKGERGGEGSFVKT
jgi:hypothetical protein